MRIPLFRVRDLQVYRETEGGLRMILDHVRLDLDPGEWVDLEGSSGCGKSTLLEALAQLIPRAKGRIELEGQAVEHISPPVWRSEVTLFPQKVIIFKGTVRDNLTAPWTFSVRSGQPRPSDGELGQELRGMGLDDVRLDDTAGKLSVGQMVRISVLRALLPKPRVLLLDEPGASLDDLSAEKVVVRLKRFCGNGGAVLRVRHYRRDQEAVRTLTIDPEGRVIEVSS
jgi:ABC-type iron transport system FetAB ATPase subunit